MGNSPFGTIIQIGDILVSEEVVTEYFACDYGACKGACCIEGDSGAPLDERERIRVYQFLKNPLTNAFGEDFYEALSAAATHLLRG